MNQNMKHVRKDNSELEHLRRIKNENGRFIQKQAKMLQDRNSVIAEKDKCLTSIRELVVELHEMLLDPSLVDADRALAIIEDIANNSKWGLGAGIDYPVVRA